VISSHDDDRLLEQSVGLEGVEELVKQLIAMADLHTYRRH
jgi:hypothetical protein